MTERVMAYVMAALLFLGVGQMWAGSVDQKAHDAGIVADSASARAERTVKAITRTRAHTLHVSDSLQAVVVSAVAHAAEAAYRASEALVEAEALTVEIGEGRGHFRGALIEVAPYMVERFDGMMRIVDIRQEQMEIAVAEGGARAVSLEQALRTITRDRDGLRNQIGREALAQSSLTEALEASQAEAAGWKRAAHPGFVLGLWRDLPKLALYVGVGIVIDQVFIKQ